LAITIKVAAQAVQFVLEPVIAAVEVIATFVAGIDPTAFDLGILTPYFSDVDVVHIYPWQQYKVLRFGQFSQAVGGSLSVSTPCTEAPADLLVIGVTATGVGRLQELAEELGALFGFSRTGFDDLPEILDRSLLNAQETTCMRVTEMFPWLGDLAEWLEAFFALTGPSTIRALQRALLMKLRILDRQLNRINDILTAIQQLDDLPTVTMLLTQVQGLGAGAITAAMTTADGAPSTDYMAGTAILMPAVTSAIVQPLLGV
jgi:hypothetical protein